MINTEYFNEFGDLNNFIIATNNPEEITEGNGIVIISPDCDVDWDVVTACFEPTMFAFIVSLEITDIHCDTVGYVTADAIIIKVKERGY